MQGPSEYSRTFIYGTSGTGQGIPFREDGTEILYTEDGIPWFAGLGPKSFVPYMEVSHI